ncbi:MAG TPA: hypothetical protein VKY73_15630 [Polyangiaceae bacterium]|nr:hypothetical protein [Polyangiaceae bacterium]
MHRAYRLLIFLLLCVFPLTALAVEIEEVTLEEEPVAQPKRKTTKTKKKTTTKKKKKTSKTKKKKKVKRPKPAPVSTSEDDDEDDEGVALDIEDSKKKERDDEDDEDEKEDAPGTTSIECSLLPPEVETRRVLPIACTVKKKVSRLEVRYRPPGEDWKSERMKKSGDEWSVEIPCAETAKTGDFEYQVQGVSKRGKVTTKTEEMKLVIVDSTSEPAPSLPGKEPAARCFDPSECPGDLLGSAQCPGTKKGVGVRGWGAACVASVECQKGLACVAGTCESPPKCEEDAECESGECRDGVCYFPDPEEVASSLGPKKYNWIGLHFGMDFAFVRDAVGVCGSESDDSEDWTCFAGGNQYRGTPNRRFSGNVESSFTRATMRVLFSYDRAFDRLLAGGRLGFAFNGAPEGFLPIHLEARVGYSLTKDPMSKRLRPYLGVAAGLAQVDTQAGVQIIDCPDPACESATQDTQLVPYAQFARNLTAYHSGPKVFFGPTAHVQYALSNESALAFTLNVMFPDIVFQPTIGYHLGL